MGFDVQRIEMQPQSTAFVSGTAQPEAVAEFLAGAFGDVLATLRDQGMEPSGPPFARYAPDDAGLRIQAGFPCPGHAEPAGRVQPGTLPGGQILLVMHRGPYGDVERAFAAAEQWLAENEWEPLGDPWEVYLDGPEVAQPRTLVHVPCRPT